MSKEYRVVSSNVKGVFKAFDGDEESARKFLEEGVFKFSSKDNGKPILQSREVGAKDWIDE